MTKLLREELKKPSAAFCPLGFYFMRFVPIDLSSQVISKTQSRTLAFVLAQLYNTSKSY